MTDRLPFFATVLVMTMMMPSDVKSVLIDNQQIHFGDTSDFRYPDTVQDPTSRFSSYVGADNKIPVTLAKKISKATSQDEILQLLNITLSSDINQAVSFVATRLDVAERSSAKTPRPAVCLPELQTVPVIGYNHDPNFLYVPQCVRIKRCGGCCISELLTCRPTVTETRNYRIIKVNYLTNQRTVEIIPIEEHEECKCDCKITQKDCGIEHEYNEDECSCYCRNTDKRRKCLEQSDIKHWLSDECKCKCREVQTCTEGTYFDNNQCRCVQSRASNIGYERQNGVNRNNNPTRDFTSIYTANPRRKHKEDPE